MDNGLAVIARIPHPIARPKFYTTASEVATMEFARSVLNIPTPEVYAWCANCDNPVRSEYIIMQEAPGVKLEDVWHEFPLEKKVGIMYGNLYFAKDNIAGAVAADVIGDVPVAVKDSVKQRFSIGPVTARGYWKKERATMNLDRGSWKQPQDYIISLARRELAWIQQHATPRPEVDISESQNNPNSHISLFEKFLRIAPFLLPGDPAMIAPHVWHTDLHGGNIFVDQGKISSVIDWQGIWAEPLMLRARHARLVDYNGEFILKAPENFKYLDPSDKDKVREQMSSSILLYLYEKQIANKAPLFNRVLRIENGRIRTEPILFVGDTWDDEILPFRDSLIRIERYWSKLGFDFPCPIHFNKEELQTHTEEGEGWNEMQNFWNIVEGFIARDGWTPNDRYDDAVALFTDIRESSLENNMSEKGENA
ncbi:uncharacterized protein LDX57_006861 [Aspergillus melleus]|uniref:uncharacterized protein n=1 Tax=Aspergillus melleus TaxID=138277 RepID=UPI001E8E85F9|nr:uncharacterized protein LDX57_006861 [Aspergillus melleus]KAH8429192.1 hypothetical protein LDX57_006861 [Aspergillus melleus]